MSSRFSPIPDSLLNGAGGPKPNDRIGTVTRVGEDKYPILVEYRRDRWPLTPFVSAPHHKASALGFERAPQEMRDPLKRVSYLMLNHQIPSELFILAKGTSRVTEVSAATVRGRMSSNVRFAKWAHETHGITTFSQVTNSIIEDWAHHLIENHPHGDHMDALTYYAAYNDYLPYRDRLTVKPETLREATLAVRRQQSKSAGSDGDSEPINHFVVSALLGWAFDYLYDFKTDIIAAQITLEKLTEHGLQDARSGKERSKAAKAWLDARLATGAPIPGQIDRNGNPGPNRNLLRALFGLSADQVADLATKFGLAHPNPRHYNTTNPLNIPINGKLENQSWIQGFTPSSVQRELRNLYTACVVVIAYLSALRPQELLNLRSDCCTPVTYDQHLAALQHAGAPIDEAALEDLNIADPTQPIYYEITGLEFPGNDDHFDARDAGVSREIPWTVTKPVYDAIETINTIKRSRSPYLLPRENPFTDSPGTGQTTTPALMRNWIQDFIRNCNTHAHCLNLPGHQIPDDPHGAITLTRFRRTLAWWIRREPDGPILLALQYGHTNTRTGAGYANRGRNGLDDLIDMAQAIQTRDHLAEVYNSIQSGQPISGPAATPLATAAIAATTHFPGKTLTNAQVKKLASISQFQVFDNPKAGMACVYNPDKALCAKVRDNEIESPAEPDFDLCQPTCGNIARTQHHIDNLSLEIARLNEEVQSGINPEPINKRLQQRINTMERTIKAHRRHAITFHPEIIPPNEAEVR